MIPRSLIDGFTATINAVSETAKANLRRRLERMDLSDPDKAANQVAQVMTAYAERYANQVATLSVRFYDDARRTELGEALAPLPDPLYNEVATQDAARGILYKYQDDMARLDMLVARMDYETKKAAANAVIAAGAQDPITPRYARVPSGSETCLFCLMLASRGYVYRTPQTAGEDGHYHANCDCRIVPSWDGSIEGYDPRELYGKWRQGVKDMAEEQAQNQAARDGKVWSDLSQKERDRRVKDKEDHYKKRMAESSKRAKERRRDERIAAGETIQVGTYRGVRGAGTRSYLKYGMTQEEWVANGRRPRTS